MLIDEQGLDNHDNSIIKIKDILASSPDPNDYLNLLPY
jgi:hypothetical protein